MRKLIKNKEESGNSREISLEVPEKVNLVDMSNEELEKLALDMAKKAASGVVKGSKLLGVDKLVLTNNPAADVGVWGAWERACGKADLTREGLVINPEVFEKPIVQNKGLAASKIVVQNKVVK